MYNINLMVMMSLFALAAGYALGNVQQMGLLKLLGFALIAGLFSSMSQYPAALVVVGIAAAAGFGVSRDSLLPSFLTDWWYDWQYSRRSAHDGQQNHGGDPYPNSGAGGSSTFEEELRRRKAQREQNTNGGQHQSDNSQQQAHGNNSNDSAKKEGRKSYWQKKREADEEELNQRQRQQAEAEENLKRQRDDFERKQREEAQNVKPKKADDNRGSMEVLGLKSDFTQVDLKKAYHEKSKRYHPNLWQNDPKDIQKAMEEEQKKVNAAYAMLKG